MLDLWGPISTGQHAVFLSLGGPDSIARSQRQLMPAASRSSGSPCGSSPARNAARSETVRHPLISEQDDTDHLVLRELEPLASGRAYEPERSESPGSTKTIPSSPAGSARRRHRVDPRFVARFAGPAKRSPARTVASTRERGYRSRISARQIGHGQPRCTPRTARRSTRSSES